MNETIKCNMYVKRATLKVRKNDRGEIIEILEVIDVGDINEIEEI